MCQGNFDNFIFELIQLPRHDAFINQILNLLSRPVLSRSSGLLFKIQ